MAGAFVCAANWWGNRILLNLLPLEDYFLWCVGIHKPVIGAVEADLVEIDDDDDDEENDWNAEFGGCFINKSSQRRQLNNNVPRRDA